MGEVSPDNEATVESKKHYCMTPGVLNADKVIVESEDVRQIYIKALTKEMGAASRSKWEEKILGLGSPKFDKVINTKKRRFGDTRRMAENYSKARWKLGKKLSSIIPVLVHY